jgi:hypothetical protein
VAPREEYRMLIISALFLLLVGFIIGFTTYAILVKRAAAKGRLFMIDKNGKWNPFEPQPMRGSTDLKITAGGQNVPYEFSEDGMKVFVNGELAERWMNAEGKEMSWMTKE